MKTLDEILNTERNVTGNWKDRPMLSSYDFSRGMTQSDMDGIGNENTFIPTYDTDPN
jgi:hypothetical protein